MQPPTPCRRAYTGEISPGQKEAYITRSARPLHRLVYVSRQSPDTVAHLGDAVQAILRGAIPFNRTLGVTGLLVTIQGYFVQVLEGSTDAVGSTYSRILKDDRHVEPVVISAESADTRLFQDWNMCARALTPSDDAILTAVDRRRALAPNSLSPRSALRLLTKVADIQRRSALDGLIT